MAASVRFATGLRAGYRSGMTSDNAAKKDWNRWLIYSAIAVAGFGPLLLGWITGDYELVRRLAETPVVVGLVAFLVKMVLDANQRAQDRADDRHREEREDSQRRHEAERAVLTQQLEHAFAVGSSSHMANVAFDKHVKFCEDYAKELRSTLATFIEKGPTEQALPHSWKLTSLRNENALWLTPEMEAPLENFEQALRDLGASEHFIATARQIDDAERQKRINLIYERFHSILGEKMMGKPDGGTALDEALAIGNVVRGLGRILGVDDLTRLRQKILSNAATSTTTA